MAFTIVSQGTFIQPATAVNQIIPLPSGVDYFKTWNLSQIAQTSSNRCVMGEWFGGGETATNISFVNDGICYYKNSSNVLDVSSFSQQSAGGFTYVTANPSPQAALTGTTITQAAAAVASVTNTYSNGDQVIIYNAVGMEQISGMVFTISSVSGSAFTLLGLNSSGFAAAATAFTVRRLSQSPVGLVTPVAPSMLYVTAVSQASAGQVTTSQQHGLVVGQKIEFAVPASYGMVQLNNFYQAQSKPVIVASVVDTYNFTINVNTTNYTAFALPASSGSPTTQLYATVAPAGQAATFNPITNVSTGYNFTSVPFRSNLFLPYMIVPNGSLAPGGNANEVIMWQAYKMETGTINAPVPS